MFFLRHWHRERGLFVHLQGGRVTHNGQKLLFYPGGEGEER